MLKNSPILKFLLRLGIAALLVFFLVRQGKLDFSTLNIFIQNFSLTLNVLGAWLLVLVLAAVRWQLLLQGLGAKLSYTQAFLLTWVGSAFNLSLPGSVSGDLLKGYQLKKQNPDISGKAVAASLLVDRLMGLAAMVFMAVCGVLTNWVFYPQRRIVALEGMVLVMLLVLVIAVVAVSFRWRAPAVFQSFFARVFSNSKLEWLRQACTAYQGKYKAVFLSFCVSVVLQVVYLAVLLAITSKLLPTIPALTDLLIIFPLGLITTAIPIAPGGAGVGHVSFEGLFELIGSSMGANIFNLYLLSMLVVFILGFIPFLWVSRLKK